MSYPTLDAALQYASQGFRVLPLKPGTKVPDLRHWPEEAGIDPATIRRQFAASMHRSRNVAPESNQPNVGIATGGSLAVLDIDVKHGGARPSWAPDTLTASTPSGGLHLYYAVGYPVPNSVGRLAPGVDVRGERGQVAAPPSRVVYFDTPPANHADTYAAYAWADLRPIARLDADFLTPEDLNINFQGRSVSAFQWRDDVPTGERNNYLTSLAGHLFATGEPEVLAELEDEAARLQFTPRDGELESIVRSVRRYHR